MVMNRHSGAGCQKVAGNLKDHHDRSFQFRQSSADAGISLLYPVIFILIPVDGNISIFVPAQGFRPGCVISDAGC
jgi:hypothetical protein